MKKIIYVLKNCIQLIKLIFKAERNVFNDLNEIHNIKLIAQKDETNNYKYFLDKYFQLINDGSMKNKKQFWKSKEYSIHSQHGEDGIICYIFSRIGIENYRCIEIGSGGHSSNTINLAANFGWEVLLIDGGTPDLHHMENKIKYRSFINKGKIKSVNKFITIDNALSTIKENLNEKSIDLLSIDIDGSDYYIWKELSRLKPRVAVLEYNASFGGLSVSVPYEEIFDKFKYHVKGWFHGASLKALEKISLENGYKLLCCESMGANAFFVRTDLCDKFDLITQTAEEAFYSHHLRTIQIPQEKQMDQFNKSKLVEI